MSSELAAIMAAVFYAATFVSSKRGLSGTSISAAILLNLGSAWVLVGTATLLDPPRSIEFAEVKLFAIAGLISPGVGYAAGLAGVHRLGPSIAVPLQQGARPLIAVAAAIMLLGESIERLQILGALAIIVGGIGLARRTSEERTINANSMRRTGGASRDTTRFIRPGISLPLIAAAAFAGFDVVARYTLTSYHAPTFGTMIVIGSGLIGWAVAIGVIPGLRASFRYGRGIPWLLIAGMCFGIATLALLHALNGAEVSTVSPILASQPLMVFVLSRLMLREVESIKPLTIILGSLVVVGTILVAA